MLTITIIASVISGAALWFTGVAARATARQASASAAQTEIQRAQVAAAQEQTELQRQLAQDALQPYVWADIQPDMQQGSVLQLVVGNAGPTVAQNVTVAFEPALPASEGEVETLEKVQTQLARGLRSLAPNRTLRWPLGAAHELLAEDSPQVRTVRVDGRGPFGDLPTLTFEIDMSQWRQSRDAPDGSLHHVRGAIQDLTKAVTAVDESLQNLPQTLKGAPRTATQSQDVR